MSQKKAKLIRKYLTKRKAIGKKFAMGNRFITFEQDLKDAYNSAISKDKGTVSKFLKRVIDG